MDKNNFYFNLICLLFCLYLFGQKNNRIGVSVEYDVILNDTENSESYQYALKYNLRSDGFKSYQQLVSYIDTTLYDNNGEPHKFESTPINNQYNFYKDIDNCVVEYGASYSFKNSGFIKDSPPFNFSNGSETKKILGYNCNQVFLSFRGRDYEIFYSPDLLYRDGPWKFYGLPGLILEVTDFENAVSMRAISIDFIRDFKMRKPSHDQLNRERFNYGDFIKKKTRWREALKAKVEAEDPMTSIEIPYRNFEIYHPYYIDNHR